MPLKIRNCTFIKIEDHSDVRGLLSVFENLKTVPFEIKRVYVIKDVPPGITRGKHAHIRLQQLAVCLSGSCQFLLDDGKNREEITLDRSDVGLYIGTLVWREIFYFSRDCVLMVLASELYDPNDYIHDYEKFLKVMKYGSIL